MRTHRSTAQTCLALMIGILALCLFSCKKTPNSIGNDLIDENTFIDVFRTDTAQVVCHSYLDSIGSKNVRFALLGSMKDPVLGTTEAGFYTQFRFSSAGQDFGSAPVLDSIVLQLALSNVYGDTSTLQTVHVYELTDSISSSDPYYSYSEISHSPVDFANGFQFRPHPKTKNYSIGSDTITEPIIRIPLSQELGNYLLQIDSTAYNNPDTFKDYFKGLFLICEAVGQNGAVCSINLTNNTITQLQLYYHDAATPQNALRYYFYITSTDQYFNHFDHDYTQGAPEFVAQLMEGDTCLGQQQVYLQSMGGIRTRISFPNISHWADTLEHSYILVNEAKLILPAPDDIDTVLFSAPTKLVLIGFKDDNTTFILPDNYEGENYFGGTYDDQSKTVSFRISEYIEKLILNKTYNYGLSLGIDGAAYNAYRWIINGPEANEEKKMRLDVTYSIVNE